MSADPVTSPETLRATVPSDTEVLAQGSVFRPSWWAEKLPEPDWAAFMTTLPNEDDEHVRIARADLLSLAASPNTSPVTTLLACYAWGTGASAFLVPGRVRTFQETGPDDIVERLEDVRATLRDGCRGGAYKSMLPTGPNYVKNLGPSFFTKFIYAADTPDGQSCGTGLVLDRFVALALADVYDWEILEDGLWPTTTYERWLDLAEAEAQTAAQELGRAVRTDAFELAMSRHGHAIYAARQRTHHHATVHTTVAAS